MKYLGIDFGLKRVGLAVGDDVLSIATSLKTVIRDAKLVESIALICEENKIEAIVVGDSKDFKMKDNTVMTEAHKFISEIIDKTKLQVFLELEFLTSVQAEQSGMKDIDATSAAIILQSFLEKKKNGMVITPFVPKIELVPEKKLATIDDFSKIEMRIGEILSAEKIEKSDKLLKLKVNFGETEPRQVLSGIAKHFVDPAVLVGKKCAFVTNLEPRPMMGLVSQAMIMAVSDGDEFALMEIPKEKNIKAGTKLK